jgi:hypothetical protein
MAPTTFTQVYNNLRPGLFESGQHVRGDEKNGYREYYTHNPLVPSGRGSEALERRRDKYARGAAIVVDALNNEYPSAVVKRVINAVSKRTGRDLYKEVTRGDLELLRKELDSEFRSCPGREVRRTCTRQDQEGHQAGISSLPRAAGRLVARGSGVA